MTTLQVRLESADDPIGYLRSNDDGGIEFAYSDEWLALPTAHAISLSLPLRDAPFRDAQTRAYFQNLLPENDQLNIVAEREGIDRNDVVGILGHLGADLSGAISCLPLDAGPVKKPGLMARDYDEIDRTQLLEIAHRLSNDLALPDELRDPSPIAGVQRKVAIVALGGDRYAVPKSRSGVPTTHILKVPDTAFPRESFYEAAAARLGAFVGLDVAKSDALWVGPYEVLLATRYDRMVTPEGAVYRLHQEDFAQALGLPPRLKYERNGIPGRSFSATAIAGLLKKTIEPANALASFLCSVFFNLAIGNSDNHAKNHAILYDKGPVPRLAPLYDLVPIRLSDRYNRLFSFYIGLAKRAEELTTADLLALFADFGLRPAAAGRFLRDRIRPMIAPLYEHRETTDEWARRFDQLIVREAQRVLELALPLEKSSGR